MNKPDYVQKPLRVALVGAGNRGTVYSDYSLHEPGQMKIAAVVEPDEYRRGYAAKRYNVPESDCFASVQDFIDSNIEIDAVINATMDREHIPTALPILKAGYDMLLEKPICLDRNGLFRLYDYAQKYRRKIMICHVLRYAPFYVEIKKRILNGDLGEIINIQTEENVSYHHFATSFVRGKWGNSDVCGSKIIMQKCCHDLDLITWLKSGVAPRYVGSLGGLKKYRPENAPAGSGLRCLSDCEIEETCPYSAGKIYIENGRWPQYAWTSIEHLGENLTTEAKIESLRNDNPYGRCVWHCDNNVEDHQAVIVEFADGTTAVHILNGGVPKPCRTIHITGTRGELLGTMEDALIEIRHSNPGEANGFSTEKINLDIREDMHGGGDLRLVDDFVKFMKGKNPSISCTNLKDSIYGHLIGFAAIDAMRDRKIVEISI
jgi:predicted dehydrogenase